jgi:hypothetical protein
MDTDPYATRFVLRQRVSPFLYSQQLYDTDYYSLSQNMNVDSTNQLNKNKGLLQLPLQVNNPYGEPLRTQEIMVTPYNCVKYNV